MNWKICANLAAVAGLACTLAVVPARSVPPSGTFTAGMLKVERFGNPSGRPVIMIPGLFCGSWEFNGQIAALAPRNDLYVLTLPGMDGRPRDDGGHLMERAMANIDALIRERKMQKPIIVGHSLGGTIAVDFGETYPNDASQIISLEGGMPAAATAAASKASANSEAKQYQVDAKTFIKNVRTNTLQYTITDTHDVDAVTALAERTDPKAAADWVRAALGLYLTPGLTNMRARFTYIAPYDEHIDSYLGFKTLAAKREAAALFAKHAPHGTVMMITPARHFMMLDQPSATNQALETLIQ